MHRVAGGDKPFRVKSCPMNALMPANITSPPVVLCISGHDPSGGAGIQADIEAIAAHHCHPVGVISCLTVQNTRGVHQVEPVATDLLTRQLDCLLEDLTPDAIKIGLLPNRETAHIIGQMIAPLALPVVLDPILRAGSDDPLCEGAAKEYLLDLMARLNPMLTPNIPEATQLGASDNLEQCAQRLLQQGCRSVLISGTHSSSTSVIHRLFPSGQPTVSCTYPRLSGEYHGSGCTLAASLAACIARGDSLTECTEAALDYTWQTLQHAYQVGKGQFIPRRLAPLSRDH